MLQLPPRSLDHFLWWWRGAGHHVMKKRKPHGGEALKWKGAEASRQQPLKGAILGMETPEPQSRPLMTRPCLTSQVQPHERPRGRTTQLSCSRHS